MILDVFKQYLPDIIPLWALVPLVALLLLTANALWIANKPSLRAIPGPLPAAYTNWWRLIDVARGHHHDTLLNLHRRHGKFVRIGPNAVSVADPEAVKTIYGLKSGFTKVIAPE